jgi:biopolymer transport protein TolR
VLLIMFMITAPLIQQGVKLNLPQARAAPVEATEKKLVVSVDARRRVFIGEAEIRLDQLEEKLRANARAQADKELYLYADRTLPYGTVMEVMTAAQRAGITNLGMITDPVAPPKRPSTDGE